MPIAPHIIISRTDNIGDVTLTLPMATLLKQHFPTCKISFLARDYVASIVASYPDIDAFVSWDRLQDLPFFKAKKALSDLQADTILHVFPNRQLAKLAKAAGITNRIGSSRRVYHWFTCNQRVNFSRKNSTLHEAQLNLQLLRPLGVNTRLSLRQLQQLLRLPKNTNVNNHVKGFLTEGCFNLVVHPLTNGHTPEWSLNNFKQLVQMLPREKFAVIITGTQKERPRLQMLLRECPQAKDAVGKLTLAELLQLLSNANAVIANSTGPLHLGAALGMHAMGLYSTKKGLDVLRWGPIGKQVRTVSAADIQRIEVAEVVAIIKSWQQ